MEFKRGTWTQTAIHWFFHPIICSVLLAILIIAGLIFGVKKWLDSYTEHGREFVLVDLKDKTVTEAEEILAKDGLHCTVIDSMYSSSTKPGHIIDQVPNAGGKVKEGRNIYLYIRARQPRKVKMPEFKDKSIRQLQGEMESAGLRIKDVQFIPSEFNTVFSVDYNGKPVSAGDNLTEGSALTIKVGKGTSNDLTEMPSLRGLLLDEARNKVVQSLALNVKTVFDVQPSSKDNERFYRVWSQSPAPKAKLNGNEMVTLYLTTNKSKYNSSDE